MDQEAFLQDDLNFDSFDTQNQLVHCDFIKFNENEWYDDYTGEDKNLL
jgi:hypothetical protein